jgi:hypothetical protein
MLRACGAQKLDCVSAASRHSRGGVPTALQRNELTQPLKVRKPSQQADSRLGLA